MGAGACVSRLYRMAETQEWVSSWRRETPRRYAKAFARAAKEQALNLKMIEFEGRAPSEIRIEEYRECVRLLEQEAAHAAVELAEFEAQLAAKEAEERRAAEAEEEVARERRKELHRPPRKSVFPLF